jgi:hypothetical protein
MLINHARCHHGPGAGGDLCRMKAKRLPLGAIRWVTGYARFSRPTIGVVVQHPVSSPRPLVGIHRRDMAGHWLPASMLELTPEQAAQLGAALVEAAAAALDSAEADRAGCA